MLDCIASGTVLLSPAFTALRAFLKLWLRSLRNSHHALRAGTIWVDMKATGVDILISAPQKGWTAPACAGLVLMNQRAKDYASASAVSRHLHISPSLLLSSIIWNFIPTNHTHLLAPCHLSSRHRAAWRST